MRRRLVAEVRRLGLESRVTFLGERRDVRSTPRRCRRAGAAEHGAGALRDHLCGGASCRRPGRDDEHGRRAAKSSMILRTPGRRRTISRRWSVRSTCSSPIAALRESLGAAGPAHAAAAICDPSTRAGAARGCRVVDRRADGGMTIALDLALEARARQSLGASDDAIYSRLRQTHSAAAALAGGSSTSAAGRGGCATFLGEHHRVVRRRRRDSV